MTTPAEAVDAIAKAVLYEGYLLYPYRPSAIKNQVRWTFGGVHPRAWTVEQGGSEPWIQQTECLLEGGPGARLEIELRFLQLIERRTPGGPKWQEATEQRLALPELDIAQLVEVNRRQRLAVAGGRVQEGQVSRRRYRLEGWLEVSAERLGPAFRVRLRAANTTPVRKGLSRDQAMLRSLVSTHAVLRVRGGAFTSLADPPLALREEAAQCRNLGTWPVLVGEPGSTDTMLSSPIILEDYPKVADESPGELFDSTEIDELLTLRILTLTDREREEMREGDERARALLERTENLTTEQLMRMHGALRGLGAHFATELEPRCQPAAAGHSAKDDQP